MPYGDNVMAKLNAIPTLAKKKSSQSRFFLDTPTVTFLLFLDQQLPRTAPQRG